jgi:cell division protein FtsB
MKATIHRAVRAILARATPIRLAVVAILVAVFYFLVLGDQGIYQLRRLVVMKHKLLAERTEQSAKIDRLTRERDELSNPANLEMHIRSELGHIKPGEVVFEEKKPATP